jgi:phosphate starvation-inducible PhoH-like protein
MFACMKAIDLLKSRKLNKIVITRPIVSVEEEELGFLPGNLVKKMDPWTRPIMDIFMEFYSKTEMDNMIYNNIIEISPLAYMRGRTFKNSFIIADEMQNSTPNQMLMLTTRIGENSKLVITGDLKQTDRVIDKNGLSDLINKVKIYNNNHNETKDSIEIIEFDKEDIERSKIVEKVIDIYQFKETNINNNSKYSSDAALIPLNRIPRNL